MSVCVTVGAHVCVCMSVYLCMSLCVHTPACSMGKERPLSVTLQSPEQDLPGGCAFSVAIVSEDHLPGVQGHIPLRGGVGFGQLWECWEEALP